MPSAVPWIHASRGSVALRRKQSGAHSAQVVEAQDEEDEEEQVFEANEAFEDEVEADSPDGHRKTAQSRSEPNRQFSRKHQSSEDSKARLDKLKQRLPCASCG